MQIRIKVSLRCAMKAMEAAMKVVTDRITNPNFTDMLDRFIGPFDISPVEIDLETP